MLLLLGAVLLVAAVAALNAALAKEEAPRSVAAALDALERGGTSTADLVHDSTPSFADRILDPLQARALTLGRRITGADKAERIRHKLDLAGNPRGWSVDRVVSLKVLGAIVLPLGGAAWSLLLGFALTTVALVAIALFFAGFFGPNLYLYQRAYDRSESIRKSLADAIDLLTISVEAGLGFDAALQQVARNTDGPLAEELARTLREMQLGKSRAEALKAIGDRTNVDDLKSFVTAMVQGDSFGISIGHILRVQSGEVRIKRRQHAEARAQQVPVKIMVPLVLFVLPCLFVVVIGPAVINMASFFSS